MAASLSSVSAVEASRKGSLAGFSCRCSCGMELRSSLRTLLEQDAAAHLAYHARKAVS